MWNLLRTAAAPILSRGRTLLQPANQFLDNFMYRQAVGAARSAGPSVRKAARAGSPLAQLNIAGRAPVLQAIVGTGFGIPAADAALNTDPTGITRRIESGLNQVGPAVDRFFGAVTPQNIQRLGREQENQSFIQALDPTFGVLSAIAPGTNPPQRKPPMPGLPANYKQQELAAGMAAERFRPGAGFIGQQSASPASVSSPAERAYQSEVSRVAQMTAQDPELQRYERARQMAVAPGATPEQVQSAEDIGMQIWAAKNPALAAKVKPGQAGYDIIQGTMAGQAAAQGFGYQMPQQMIMTPPPGPNVPQGLPAVESIGAAETYGDKGLVVDPEMAKKFQALLNQSKG